MLEFENNSSKMTKILCIYFWLAHFLFIFRCIHHGPEEIFLYWFMNVQKEADQSLINFIDSNLLGAVERW